jgi:uncharacterized protein (DUF1015 family)
MLCWPLESMATIKPFAALRPKPELAARICELPYDVMSSEEARQIAAGNPLSFLHVSKPEIDLPPGTGLYAPEVYAKGRENFGRLLARGALRQDAEPCFYLYRQVMGQHSQVGVVAAASCQEYLAGFIRRHELTRPDKEDDRLRHIETLQAQTGPVFLVYRASQAIDELVTNKTAEPPEIDFTAVDGVRHSAWVIADAPRLRALEAAFARIPCLYIADGHHRCAAAARVDQGRQGQRATPLAPAESASFLVGQASRLPPLPATPLAAAESPFFLSVIFPHDQAQILPYNRVVKDLNGLSPRQLLEKLDGVFVVRPGGPAAPTGRGQLALWLEGQWHGLSFRPRFAATTDPIENLDVTLLQKHVLDPIFGIADPRTSQRLNFVGGSRGPEELERLVRRGEYACAFSLFPTSIEDLMTIADAGGLMPPKSTWFEPKLRDALFCHCLRERTE